MAAMDLALDLDVKRAILSGPDIETWIDAEVMTGIDTDMEKQISDGDNVEREAEVLIKLWICIVGDLAAKLKAISVWQQNLCLLESEDLSAAIVSSDGALSWVQKSYAGCFGYEEHAIVKAVELYTTESLRNLLRTVEGYWMLKYRQCGRFQQRLQEECDFGATVSQREKLSLMIEDVTEEIDSLDQYMKKLEEARIFVIERIANSEQAKALLSNL